MPHTASLPLPNRQQRAYLSAFRIAAVYISIPPAGPIGIGIGAVRDLAQAPPAVVAAWWCAELASAETVADHAESVDLRGGGARTIDQAVVAILAAARRLDVRLTPHDAVMARARMATRKIAERVEQAAKAGDLRFFNVLFQQKRRAAELEGKRLDYSTARARFEQALAHVAASRGDPGVTTDVLAMVFGEAR